MPRRSSVSAYADPFSVAMDLAGQWWLLGPRGDACLVWLSARESDAIRIVGPCAPQLVRTLQLSPALDGDKDGRVCSIAIDGERLMVRCGEDGSDGDRERRKPTLTFSLHDLDFPVGIGASKGYRLLRVTTP